MKRLVVTLDDHGGMLFGTKRQSSDRVLSQHIFQSLNGETLYANAYTSKLLTEQGIAHTLCDSPLAVPSGVVFVEDVKIEDLSDFDAVTIYHWNRSYPTTLNFPLTSLSAFRLDRTETFVGSSHENILCEVYVK